MRPIRVKIVVLAFSAGRRCPQGGLLAPYQGEDCSLSLLRGEKVPEGRMRGFCPKVGLLAAYQGEDCSFSLLRGEKVPKGRMRGKIFSPWFRKTNV